MPNPKQYKGTPPSEYLAAGAFAYWSRERKAAALRLRSARACLLTAQKAYARERRTIETAERRGRTLRDRVSMALTQLEIALREVSRLAPTKQAPR